MTHQLWYIHQDGRRYGPITDRELLYLARISKLDPDAHVWSVGLAKWRRAGDLDGLFQPPPFDEPGVALDFSIGPAALPRPVLHDSQLAGIQDQSGEAVEQRLKDAVRRRMAARERADRTSATLDAVPMRRQTGATSAQALPAADTEAQAAAATEAEAETQDHANDNRVKEDDDVTRRLLDRVAKLEQAVAKEAHDRRRLKNAIEALVDYLATESDAEHGARPAPHLATSAPAIEAQDEDVVDPERPMFKPSAARDDAALAPLQDDPDALGYIAQHWFGEHSLGRSFWANALAPAVLLTVFIAVVAASSRHSALWGNLVLVLAMAGAAPLFVWMGTGLLRASHRKQLMTGRRIAPSLARAWVLVAFLAWLGTPILVRVYPSVIPAPVLSIIDMTPGQPAARKGDKSPEGRLDVPRARPSGTDPAPGKTPAQHWTA